jgi:lipooligosaccharide transport system permease protein
MIERERSQREERPEQEVARGRQPEQAPQGTGIATLAQPHLGYFQERMRLRTGWFWSLYGVWYRHVRVYTKTLLANAMPPVWEPFFFFTAIALGIGSYMPNAAFDGLNYATFVASGLVVGSAMFTAIFETTFGSFVRLVYQKTYDAMLGTHLTINQIFIGELLFTATKGAVFSSIVLGVTAAFGVRPTAWCVLVPVIGAATAYLFGTIGLIVTSYVRMINNFSFFTSGIITPLFFFSGTFFPIRGHSAALTVIASALPLTPAIELSRALYKADFTRLTFVYLLILCAYLVVCHKIALRRMRKRVLS